MTWQRYVGALVAILGLKWLIYHRSEEFAAYVVAALIAIGAILGYLRHVHRQQAELRLFQADVDERAQLLANLPPAQAATLRFTLRSFEDIDLSFVPAPVEFAYPPGSRSLSTMLFWLAALFAVGFLVPIVRGTAADQESAMILFGLAGLMLLAIIGHRMLYSRIGARVRVDEVDITATSADQGVTQLRWSDLVAVRYRRWIGALDYEADAGRRIRVWLTLVDFAHFVQLTLIHRHRNSAAGAV